jgi:hypothetical protein
VWYGELVLPLLQLEVLTWSDITCGHRLIAASSLRKGQGRATDTQRKALNFHTLMLTGRYTADTLLGADDIPPNLRKLNPHLMARAGYDILETQHRAVDVERAEAAAIWRMARNPTYPTGDVTQPGRHTPEATAARPGGEAVGEHIPPPKRARRPPAQCPVAITRPAPAADETPPGGREEMEANSREAVADELAAIEATSNTAIVQLNARR